MQEGNKKEKWGKPKLIILHRGKPEEGVLIGCKLLELAGGPSTTHLYSCKGQQKKYFPKCSLECMSVSST